MEQVSPEELKKQVKVYIAVFVALAFFTIVTVAISYLKLPIVPAVIVALVVASIKGGLVAAYFMHLLHEKKIIIYILLLAVTFFFVCLLIPVLGQ